MASTSPQKPLYYVSNVPAEINIPNVSVFTELQNAAKNWPTRVALDFYGQQTTYSELFDQVSRGARFLAEQGVKAGDRVALVIPNSPAHVVAFYAVLRLGAIVVEHNPTYTGPQLAHQLQDSGAVLALIWHHGANTLLEIQDQTAVKKVVVVDIAKDLPKIKQLALRLPLPAARKTARALRGEKHQQLDWHEMVAKTEPISATSAYPEHEDVALLQYTGGTTGTPKGAILTHRNLVSNVHQARAWTAAQGGDEVVYGILPFFHAFGLTLCLTYAMSIGATLVLFPKFEASTFLKTQRRLPCTFLPAVPTMLAKIIAAVQDPKTGQANPKYDLTSIKYTISGAMALPKETATQWEAITGGLAIEGYGMTETSPVALGSPLNEHRRPGTLGLPFPSTKIRVTSQEDPSVEVKTGELGELQIKGPEVFAGYWGAPEETAEQLLPGGWLRTGDLVQIDETGFVTLVDRSKEMIISSGFKVYPSQVEDEIRLMPGVQEVAVVGVPAGSRGETVLAALVLEPGIHIDLNAVRQWCEDKIARYAIPKKVVVLSELPRSQVGKVLRRVVRERILNPMVPTSN